MQSVSGKINPKRKASTMAPQVSEIRQRVLSARTHRVKSLQNQLAVAQQQVNDLVQENRSLRTTIHRQERALQKLDTVDLSKIIASHHEEIRIGSEKSKSLQKTVNEMSVKLKQRDSALLALSDQNKHLQQLNRDRHLEERVKLTEQLRDLTDQLTEREQDLKLLARKNQLETKMLRSHLNTELGKVKELQKQLDTANLEITRLNLLQMQMNCNGGTLIRYNNLRATHSAATNLSYRQFDHQLQKSSNNSFYSRSPLLDSYRNETLYEEEIRDVEIEKIKDTVDEDQAQESQVHSGCLTSSTTNELNPIPDHTPENSSSRSRKQSDEGKAKLLAALKAIDSFESA